MFNDCNLDYGLLLNRDGTWQFSCCSCLTILKPCCAEAHKYFIDYISKAYQALTDPISRENFEKYGHPDGRQVILQEEKLSFDVITFLSVLHEK